MYRFVRVQGELVEICDECGYNGSLVAPRDVEARLGTMVGAWSEVLACDEALLRTRPAPATWCAAEYARHTAGGPW